MAKAKVVTKATKKNKGTDAAQTYCLKCQKTTNTKDSIVLSLYSTGRLLRRGTCSECGTNVSGIVKTGTPYDRKQTKKEYDEAQSKKKTKKDNFLGKKDKPDAVATTVKKAKKVVEVARPTLKRKEGESKKELEARTDRVWEKRKAEANA